MCKPLAHKSVDLYATDPKIKASRVVQHLAEMKTRLLGREWARDELARYAGEIIRRSRERFWMALNPELYGIIEAHLGTALYGVRVIDVHRIDISFGGEAIGVMRFGAGDMKALLHWPDRFPESGPVFDPVPIDFHDPDSFKMLDDGLREMRGEILTPLQYVVHYACTKELWWGRTILIWCYLFLAIAGAISIAFVFLWRVP